MIEPSTPPITDSDRWAAAKRLGFPHRVYNPEHNITYWRVINDGTFPPTPDAAIDAAILAERERAVPESPDLVWGWLHGLDEAGNPWSERGSLYGGELDTQCLWFITKSGVPYKSTGVRFVPDDPVSYEAARTRLVQSTL